MNYNEKDSGPRDVLISIKPAYANLIVDGIKTIELRRRFSENLPAGTKIYIYSTSPEQTVIGECEIKEIIKKPLEKLWSDTATAAMISKQDFDNYFDGLTEGYGIRVWKYKRYNKPKSLSSYLGKKATAPQSYRYLPGLEA